MKTRIPWCHYTVNFWWGCTKCSRGCDNCYAKALAARFGRGKVVWGPKGRRWLRYNEALAELIAIDKTARKTGLRFRVFINSMSDSFEANSMLDVARCAMFCAMEMFPDLDFILLTKRPENIRTMVPPAWLETWPANVIPGITAEDQAAWDRRRRYLLDLPAARRMVSIEPMLGPIKLFPKCFTLKRPGSLWLVVGGESGCGARPFVLEDACNILIEGKNIGAKLFVKQLGAKPYTSNVNMWDIPDHVRMNSDGTTAAGAFLKLRDRDGRDPEEWPDGFDVREFPGGVS